MNEQEEGLINLLGADPSVTSLDLGLEPSTGGLSSLPGASSASSPTPTSSPSGFPYASERQTFLGLGGAPTSMGNILLRFVDQQKGPGIFSPWYAAMRKQAGGALTPPQSPALPSVLNPIISAPIPTASLGERMIPPPSEAQAQTDYDFTLNTLKSSPVYPGASFANVIPEGYNTLGNIQENQGMSPYDQAQRSMVTGTTTGQLSQTTSNPGNQTGLSSLSNTVGAFS